MKIKKLLLAAVFCSAYSFAQVGVGTTTPEGALDVSSTTNGLVPPRVALTASNVSAPVVNPNGGGAPVAGTVVYNTATAGTSPNNVDLGLYFWNGTRWVAFAGSAGGLDWSLIGNTGTVAGTNFLGTTDNISLDFRTNNAIRGRFENTGRLGINIVPQTFAQSISYSNVATIDALSGYSGVDGGTGVYARSQGSGGTGVYASNNNTGGWGAYGYNSNTTSGVGTVGQSAGATGVGIVGLAEATSYSTLTGYSQGVVGTGEIGVYGMSIGAVDAQRYGGYFSYDTDNNLSTSDANSPVAILAGRGNSFLGTGPANTIYFGGYFSGGQDKNANTPTGTGTTNSGGDTGDFAYVGARWDPPGATGVTNYKILGSGVVSTIVKGDRNEEHVMFAPEAPEILFQDYGIGTLKNGKVQITIDPILAKNIVVNEKHPLKVFIQLEGDCNGVFVTDKSAKGFTVKELQNGRSNVSFSYQIVATRADRVDSNGKVISNHENVRFPIAPTALEHIKTTETKAKIVEDKKIELNKDLDSEKNH